MEEKQSQRQRHCLILPYPVQGHINPMLQFAKRLLQKKITITILITDYQAKKSQFSSTNIPIETFSDGSNEGFVPSSQNVEEYLQKFETVGSKTLNEAILRLADSGRPVDCLIYDSFLPWGLDVAKEMGLMGAAFFTQSCAVDHIYHCVSKGLLKLPLKEDEDVILPGLPKMKPVDMPSFVYVHGSYPPLFDVVVNQQFRNIEKADWLLINTFYKLEEELIDHMAKLSPVKAIGPTIPSMYLDKRLPKDKEYGVSVFKPMSEACMNWLNERQPQSTIYVSFGSLAQLEEDQMHELAWGLKLSNKNFLWVVRASEESKLPQDFVKETYERGLIVSWCPQLDVLAHDAICCFITHCGWNSTLEALSLGVPMVAMPQWTDQSTNAKFVMDIWKMGVRVSQTIDSKLVDRYAIAQCISDVVEGERSEEIKKHIRKWKEMAKESMGEGGSSDANIEEFVSNLSCVSQTKAWLG